MAAEEVATLVAAEMVGEGTVADGTEVVEMVAAAVMTRNPTRPGVA